MIDTSTKITKVTSQLIYSRIRKNCNIVCLMQLKSRSYMLMKIIRTPNIVELGGDPGWLHRPRSFLSRHWRYH